MTISFSIITPTYNSAHFLEKNLQSVKQQTWPMVEHVVMDGGSTDSTEDIVRRYEGTYNLIWRSEPDRGQCDAYNKALNLVTNDWVLCLNSDDYLLDDAVLEKVARAIMSSPGYHIYMGHIWAVSENGERLGRSHHYGLDVLTHQQMLNKFGICIHQATFVQQQVFEKVGGFLKEYYYHMDYEFLLRATRFFEVRFIEEFVAAMGEPASRKTAQRDYRSAMELISARRAHGGSFWHRHTFYALKLMLQLILPLSVQHALKHNPVIAVLLDKCGWRDLSLHPLSRRKK
jgi:glycosyltransferase involved in cell wall biosynthesis